MNALETKVLELIGEDVDSPDVFVDTDDGLEPIRDSLNDAIQEIVMLTGSRKIKYYLPLRQEQMFYRFTMNGGYFGWVTDAWNINQKRRLEQTDLIRLNHHDPRWMVANAEPRSYFQIGSDILGVHPKPSTDTNTLELTVVQIPKGYQTSSDKINLRRDFQYAAVNFAVAEYWAGRGDARQAETFYQLYLDALGIRERFTNMNDYVPRMDTVKEPWPKETA